MLRILTTAAILTGLLGTAAVAETFEVKMLNKSGKERMVFEPDFVRIASGDTVRFVPTDKGHNAQTIKDRIPEGAEPFKGKMSKEFEVSLTKEGLYAIECKPHFAMGMVMTIAVGDIETAPDSFLEGRIPKKAKKRFEAQLSNL
ncbi:pseudoazurin [Cohaesibacter sp. ES.047]|uniref:pseudoazurin n=1 Tax=Cohaesibacter sp. ES.047 TaxID=1798205 RepID=UPI000BB95978|nr:pseudoazurin [Cohaesibacter sp. ES.047]SNY91166.1 pseudoazurin [Cohaesibacter sp. ES.047]